MKNENAYFTVTPRIIREGSQTKITISPRFGHVKFAREASYSVTHTPMEDLGSKSSFREELRPDCALVDGTLVFEVLFEGEQEHSFVVTEVRGDREKQIGDFRIYSVADDLFDRRPYKGDLHIHSNRSDGRESPGYVAASCRKIGLDFMAVTDHGRYEPSIEAQQAFDGVTMDLRVFRGEEVHPPDNPIHIINFGGDRSINDMFSEPVYRREVSEIQNSATDLPIDLDPYYYASSIWCFRAIRAVGGLGIFCHPYWESRNRYHIPGSLTSKLFDEAPYDAYELIGGYMLNEVESNMLQVLRYQEEIRDGRDIPVVGVSDAHGCDRGDLFGWYYTIAFADSCELPDLISSIKACRSVAVESLPGTTPRAHGPLRYAKYAHFLLREVLPQHDLHCREEGMLMLAHLSGGVEAKRHLKELSGRSGRYLNSCYGGV